MKLGVLLLLVVEGFTSPVLTRPKIGFRPHRILRQRGGKECSGVQTPSPEVTTGPLRRRSSYQFGRSSSQRTRQSIRGIGRYRDKISTAFKREGGDLDYPLTQEELDHINQVRSAEAIPKSDHVDSTERPDHQSSNKKVKDDPVARIPENIQDIQPVQPAETREDSTKQNLEGSHRRKEDKGALRILSITPFTDTAGQDDILPDFKISIGGVESRQDTVKGFNGDSTGIKVENAAAPLKRQSTTQSPLKLQETTGDVEMLGQADNVIQSKLEISESKARGKQTGSSSPLKLQSTTQVYPLGPRGKFLESKLELKEQSKPRDGAKPFRLDEQNQGVEAEESDTGDMLYSPSRKLKTPLGQPKNPAKKPLTIVEDPGVIIETPRERSKLAPKPVEKEGDLKKPFRIGESENEGIKLPTFLESPEENKSKSLEHSKRVTDGKPIKIDIPDDLKKGAAPKNSLSATPSESKPFTMSEAEEGLESNPIGGVVGFGAASVKPAGVSIDSSPSMDNLVLFTPDTEKKSVFEKTVDVADEDWEDEYEEEAEEDPEERAARLKAERKAKKKLYQSRLGRLKPRDPEPDDHPDDWPKVPIKIPRKKELDPSAEGLKVEHELVKAVALPKHENPAVYADDLDIDLENDLDIDGEESISEMEKPQRRVVRGANWRSERYKFLLDAGANALLDPSELNELFTPRGSVLQRFRQNPLIAYGVVVPLEGVLLDTTAFHYETWKRLAKRYGLPRPSVDGVRMATSLAPYDAESFENSVYRIFGRVGLQSHDIMVQMRQDFVNAVFKRIDRRIGLDSVTTMDGAAQWIQGILKEGVHMSIVTKLPKTEAVALMEAAGLNPEALGPNAIVTGEGPESQILLRASLAMMRQPRLTVAVTDRPAGTMAAQEAGMRSLSITSRYSKFELDGSDVVVAKYDEFVPTDLRRMFSDQDFEATEYLFASPEVQ